MRCQPFVFGLLCVRRPKPSKMFAGRVRVGTHDVHDVQFFFLKLSSRLSSAHLWCTHVHRAAMFGHRTSDFTSVSLNIFHASKLSANVWPLTVSSSWATVRCSLYFEKNKKLVDHITPACGLIFMLQCFLVFFGNVCFVHHSHTLGFVSITTVRPRISIAHAQSQIKHDCCTHYINHHVVFGSIVCNVISLHVHTRSERHGVFGSHC